MESLLHSYWEETLPLNDNTHRRYLDMALAFLLDFPGATQEQFDQAAEKLGSTSPPGLLYHFDGPIAGGWRVVDVWESQEALDTFFQEKLGQALQEAGVAMPQPQVWPAHRIVKP
jgi:hypothetical protein